MQIFVDESGDLGFTLDKPNRQGGSSKYITIAGVAVFEEQFKYLRRDIADIYRKYNLTPGIEKKGAKFTNEEAKFICESLWRARRKCTSLRIISITARKEKVLEHLRTDTNIFYNYMLGMLLPDTIKKDTTAEIIIDKRTIKVGSGRSFEDYIKTKCWGELQITTDIKCSYDESDKNEGIWVADWVANFIWRRYEDAANEGYSALNLKPNKNELKALLYEKTLFMND